MIVDFSAVGNRGDVKLFSVGGVHLGRRRSSLGGERARREKESKEREKQEKTFHSAIRCKKCSVRGNEAKSVENEAVERKGYHYK